MRPGGLPAGGEADELGTDGGAAGFGRGRPDRSDAEVVQVFRVDGGIYLFGGMSGEANARPLPDDRTCDRRGKVLLPEVQHGRGGDADDVGPVVDRPQCLMTDGDLGEDAQDLELLAALQGLSLSWMMSTPPA